MFLVLVGGQLTGAPKPCSDRRRKDHQETTSKQGRSDHWRMLEDGPRRSPKPTQTERGGSYTYGLKPEISPRRIMSSPSIDLRSCLPHKALLAAFEEGLIAPEPLLASNRESCSFQGSPYLRLTLPVCIITAVRAHDTRIAALTSRVFAWIGGLFIAGARFSNYVAWLDRPAVYRPGAQPVPRTVPGFPSIVQDVVNGDSTDG